MAQQSTTNKGVGLVRDFCFLVLEARLENQGNTTDSIERISNDSGKIIFDKSGFLKMSFDEVQNMVFCTFYSAFRCLERTTNGSDL